MKMKKRKLTALLLALVMAVSLMPVTAFAASIGWQVNGTVEQANYTVYLLTSDPSSFTSMSELQDAALDSGTIVSSGRSYKYSGITTSDTITSSANYYLVMVESNAASEYYYIDVTEKARGCVYTPPATASNLIISSSDFCNGSTFAPADITSKTITQKYKATDTVSSVEKYKIAVSWADTPIEIKVADAYKWDVATLSWVADGDNAQDGAARIAESNSVSTACKTITLKNYSPVAFTCSLSFELNDQLDTAAADSYNGDNNVFTYAADSAEAANGNEGTLAAVTNSTTDWTTDSKYFSNEAVDADALPKLVFTFTPGLNFAEFNNAEATTANVTYGTLTLTCTKAA